MINNLELIKQILTFDDENDFYMVYIIRRKKDQNTDKSNHQSSRTIKSYPIGSLNELYDKWEEIIGLSEYFKARVYIGTNKLNYSDVGLNMISKLAERLMSGHLKQNHIFESVIGEIKPRYKRWVVDIDSKELSPSMFAHIEYRCKPITEVKTDSIGIPIGYITGPKIEAIIPTKSGHHLITKPFDLKEFKDSYPDIDVVKNGFTLLYYPTSLENN